MAQLDHNDERLLQLSSRRPFLKLSLGRMKERTGLQKTLLLDGKSLNIAQVVHVYTQPGITVDFPKKCLDVVMENANYFRRKLTSGLVVYGANTGFGGSADVRNNDTVVIQEALVRLLNAGFGETFDPALSRAVMLVRANSLCKGFSAVRPEIIEMLSNMIRENILPLVPKRGSISASGDLMPTSYIVSAMMGKEGTQVIHDNIKKSAKQALEDCSLNPIEFIDKEALAIVNSTGFSSALASRVLYDTITSLLLTQVCVAMGTEALVGKKESFHPIIHQCLPHPGQGEVAKNLLDLLHGSMMCISDLDMDRDDVKGVLKQDRYALRTAPQWLGPGVEMVQRAVETVEIELNCVGDNPIVCHESDEILQGGNFQGSALAVAMDNTRQALQMCGKLLFGLMSELVNVNLNNNLPPNLSGSDVSSDFGFKGMDIAMASYMSELDMLTSPVTPHMLSAELNNQNVNSLALLSARWTEHAHTVLQQMLANILLTLTQACDLRWLQGQVKQQLITVFEKHSLGFCLELVLEKWKWYDFAFCPVKTSALLVTSCELGVELIDASCFIEDMRESMETLMNKVKGGKHAQDVENHLGQGTRRMYRFIRQDSGLDFNSGSRALDKDLQKIHTSFTGSHLEDFIQKIFTF